MSVTTLSFATSSSSFKFEFAPAIMCYSSSKRLPAQWRAPDLLTQEFVQAAIY
jgi:hypothetical protein